MSEFRISEFERGFTDNYVNGLPNAGERYDNLLISRNKKPFSRDGSVIYDETLPLIPAGQQRIQFQKLHEGTLFEYSGDEIFYRDTTFKELNGPVNTHDAFGDLGSASTSHNSASSWQKHLFTTIDSYSRPRKIYKDENSTWQIRNVGLPSPGDVLGLNTAIILANGLKATYNVHVADASEHQLADTVVSSTDATDVDSLCTLCNELRVRYYSHEADARLSVPVKHFTVVTTNYALSDQSPIVTLDQAITFLNDFKTKYNMHDANATSHNAGSLHQNASASATRSFTVTPEAANGKSYIYGICYKYSYMVGTVTYIERSSMTQVVISNAGDFSTAANGNDLSAIPTLTNTYYGSKEAWDTANIFVEVYRTADLQTTLKRVAEIPNGTATYEDETTDANLGINAYITGGVLDNDEPPLCKYLIQTNDILWYANIKEGSQEKPYRIRHSKQLEPNSCPVTFNVDVDDAITGIGAVGINPIVFTKNKVFRLEGSVDSLGRGFVKKRVIDDTVGCVGHNSIVSVKDGIYFSSLDGFYFTDGFTAQKISNHLNDTYQNLISTETRQKRIYGVLNPLDDRVYWAVTQDAAANDNDAIWVLDPYWGFPNGEGCFTTFSYGDNGFPTAIEVQEGNLVRGDSRGYSFIHDEDILTDPVVDIFEPASDWLTTAVIYDYTSSAFSFGSEYTRKWVTKLLTVLKSLTNINLQPQSINDDSGATRDLKLIRSNSIFTWMDPLFLWGDTDFIWNAPSTLPAIRHFPRDGLRCTLKQVRYTNAFTVVINSDDFGTVTVSNNLDTLTLDSGTFPIDLTGYSVFFGDAVQGYQIAEFTDTVLTLTDSGNNLPDGVQSDWSIKGFARDERFHMESYTIVYEPFGSSLTAYRTGDDGAPS